MTTSVKIGSEFEELAARHLKKHGLKEVSRNFKHKTGEIDLIMREQDTLVFVEVRYRKQNHFGSAEESITYRKQQKIIRAASYFLTKKKLWNSSCRFDTVTIKPTKHSLGNYDINWITSAFN